MELSENYVVPMYAAAPVNVGSSSFISSLSRFLIAQRLYLYLALRRCFSNFITCAKLRAIRTTVLLTLVLVLVLIYRQVSLIYTMFSFLRGKSLSLFFIFTFLYQTTGFTRLYAVIRITRLYGVEFSTKEYFDLSK